MSEEIIGVFPSEEDSKAAKKALLDSGFAHAEIRLEVQKHSNNKRQGVDSDQTHLIVTALTPAVHKKALTILHENGATNLSDHIARYHENPLMADPDYIQEDSDKGIGTTE